MKIACFAYLHGRGGAERQITMLANSLAQSGHEVYLVALASCNLVYDIHSNVHIVDLSHKCGFSFFQIFFRYFRLLKFYFIRRPDVGIHYWLQSAYLSTLIPKVIRGKIIYSERGDPGDVEYNGFLGVIRKISFNFIDGFVFQSSHAMNFFGKKVIARSAVIRNVISIPNGLFDKPCNFREKKIINVGRLHPQKNHFLLIRAFSKIADEIPDYILEIYGDGPLKEKLMSLIVTLNLQRRIFIKSSCVDIYNKIYTSTLFVLTSDYEGMPNVLLESMALGVPCISTDYRPGSVSELINNNENGWIVSTNDVDALAYQIKFAIKNEKMRLCFSQNYALIRKNYSRDNVFKSWESFLNRIAG